MKRRKKRQNNGLFLYFAHWETLKISEANGKMRLCILGHGHTLVTKRGAFGGKYQIVIITDGARSLPYKGATKESAKKKKNGECDGIALHCINVYEYRRESGRSQGPRQTGRERRAR